jgi:plastocyanin
MSRGSSAVLLGALFLVGSAAGVLVAGGEASSDASHATSSSGATTRVVVIATDSKFKLSKRNARTGTVIFTVTNEGKVSHNFKIAGKKTPLLTPGHSATLRVTFSREGRYPYLCTVRGQASAGMKGTFVVVAAPVPPPPTTTPPPPVGTANTTVTVDMFDDPLPGGFKLSQSTMPSGNVTFVITSQCGIGCSFDLENVKAGAILGTGKSETWTVPLAPGTYRYHCDVDPTGMRGSITVTP